MEYQVRQRRNRLGSAEHDQCCTRLLGSIQMHPLLVGEESRPKGKCCRCSIGCPSKFPTDPNPFGGLGTYERHVSSSSLACSTLKGLFCEGNGIVNFLVLQVILFRVNAIAKFTRSGEVCNQSPAPIFLWNPTPEHWRVGKGVSCKGQPCGRVRILYQALAEK